MAGGDADFLYSVGIDLSTATAELEQWVKTTVPSMMTQLSQPLQLRVGYSAAITNITNFVNRANAMLETVRKPITITADVNFKGSSAALTAFMKNFTRNAPALEAFDERFKSIGNTASMVGANLDGFSLKVGKVGTSLGGVAGGVSEAEGGLGRVGGAAKGAGNVIDWLGNVAKVSAFKMVEWAVVIQTLEKTVGMFKDSLTQAGNVQMEQTLQGLYNMAGAQINVNDALKNAILIARQWGGDIVDIQQAIGLWTKQTNDLSAATMLASKGEEMARASGIDTLTVYRDSVAIGAQMGITYGQLPTVYDQVTRASLKLAEQLRSVKGEAGSSTEAMKDIFEGLKEASATLSANSFRDTASIIAMVSNQIQSMGEHGSQAAKNLSTMFGALSQGGPKRAEWEKILGVDAFKNADTLLLAMKSHLNELMQAQANGKLGVRPAQVETLATMEKSLQHILDLYKDIKDNSKGMLDATAVAEMNTFQAQSDRLHTALQALEIEIGTRLLPTFQYWTQYGATTLLPMIQQMVPAMLGVAQAATLVGAAWLALQVKGRMDSWLKANVVALESQQVALAKSARADQVAADAGFKNAASVDALSKQIAAQKAAIAENEQMVKLLTDAWNTLGEQANLTAEQIKILQNAESEAAQKAGEEAAAAKAAADANAGLATEADAASTAEQKLAVSGSEASDAVGGPGAVGRYAAAKAGLAGIAESAIATLGPLAALTAGIFVAQQAAKAWDSTNNRTNAMVGYLEQQRGAGIYNNGNLNDLPTMAQQWSTVTRGIQGLGADLHDFWYGYDSNNPLSARYQQSGAVGQSELSQLELSQYGKQALHDANVMYGSGYGSPTYTQAQSDLQDLDSKWRQGQQAQAQMTAAQKEYNSMINALTNKGKAAMGTLMGSPEGGHIFAQPGASKAGAGNPYAQATSDVTKAYQAATDAANKYAQADTTIIQTQETLIKQNGVNQNSINLISAAYKDQEARYNDAAVATQKYIAQLQAEITHDQKIVASTAATSKAHKQAAADEKNASDDLTKAEANLADVIAKRNQAMNNGSATVTKYTAQLVMAKAGVSDYKKQIEDLNKTISNTQGYAQQLNAIILSEGAVNKLSVALNACLSYVETHFPKSTTLINFFKQAVKDAENEGDKLAKSADDTTTKIVALGDALNKVGQKLQLDNFKSLADILGLDKQTVSYVDAMIQGMDQIKQDQDDINAKKKELLGMLDSQELPEVKAVVQNQLLQVQYAQDELDLKKKLLPLEQQILSIRSSTAYQAFDSEIGKMGQAGLNNLAKNMFNFGGNSSNSIGQIAHQFMSGIMTDMLDSWWKQAAAKLTDGIFGAGGPEAKLQAVMTTVEGQLQQQFTGFGSTVTGPFTAGFSTFKSASTVVAQAGKDMLQAGQMIAGKTGSSNGFTFGDQTPTAGLAWDSTGLSYDDTYGVSPSTVSESYTNISAIASATNAVPDLVDQTNQYLIEANQNLSQIADSFGSLSSIGGGSAGSGGGFLGLLGSLFGLGGGSGGGGAAAGGLGSLFTSIPGLITGALGIGSAVGGVLGAGTGAAGSAQHQQYGMFGALLGGAGALGGIIAGVGGLGGVGLTGLLAAMGPVGWGLLAGGALLGAFGGGMFGDHFPIQNEPDIGEPVVGGVSYGQFVANYTGAPGSFNGQTINPQSQYVDNPELLSVFKDIGSILANPNSTPAQKQAAEALQALEGGGGPNGGLGIKSEKDDVFTLNSGKTINVEQFMQDVANLTKAAGSQSGSTQLAPLMGVNVYGGGKNFKLNPYNTPGMTNQEFEEYLAAKWMGWQGVLYPYGTNPYGTPGVGTGGTPPPGGPYPPPKGPYPGGGGPSGGPNPNFTIQLKVDGKILAQIVNAYNAEALLNAGQSIEHVPPLQ